ncbi:hypothetical protein ACFL24_02830 [Patescibacteria group bacterium]
MTNENLHKKRGDSLREPQFPPVGETPSDRVETPPPLETEVPVPREELDETGGAVDTTIPSQEEAVKAPAPEVQPETEVDTKKKKVTTSPGEDFKKAEKLGPHAMMTTLDEWQEKEGGENE